MQESDATCSHHPIRGEQKHVGGQLSKMGLGAQIPVSRWAFRFKAKHPTNLGTEHPNLPKVGGIDLRTDGP